MFLITDVKELRWYCATSVNAELDTNLLPFVMIGFCKHVLSCYGELNVVKDTLSLTVYCVHYEQRCITTVVILSCMCVCVTNAAGYVALLLLNVLGALTYFIASVQHSVSNQSGATFGVSLLLLVLFVPCSFVCWFRPVYNAFQ